MRSDQLRYLMSIRDRLPADEQDILRRVEPRMPHEPLDYAALRERLITGFDDSQERQAKASSHFWLATSMRADPYNSRYEDLARQYFGQELAPLAAARQIAELEKLPDLKPDKEQEPRPKDQLRWYENRMTPKGIALASKLSLYGKLSLGEWQDVPWSDRPYLLDYAMKRAGRQEFTVADHFRQLGAYFQSTAQSMHDGIALMLQSNIEGVGEIIQDLGWEKPKAIGALSGASWLQPTSDGVLFEGFVDSIKQAEAGRIGLQQALLAKKQKGFGEETIVGTENVAAYMGLAAVTAGMAPYFQFTNDFRNRLVAAGIPEETALNVAALTAMPYVLIENAQIGQAMKGTKLGKGYAKVAGIAFGSADKATLAGRLMTAMQSKAGEFLLRRTAGAVSEIAEEGAQQLLEEVVFGAVTDEFGEFDGAAVTRAIKDSVGPMALLQIIAGGGELALNKGRIFEWDKEQKALDMYTPKGEQPFQRVEELANVPPAVLDAVRAAETQQDAEAALEDLGYSPELVPQVEQLLAVEDEDMQAQIAQAQRQQEAELAASEAGERAPQTFTGRDPQEMLASLQEEVAKFPSLEGVTVELANLITTPSGQSAEGAAVGDIIRVVMGAADPIRTTREEIFHQLRARNAITDAELAILQRHDQEWRDQYGIDVLYSEFSEAKRTEEGQAHRFAELPQLEEQQRGVVQKMRDLWEALRNWFRGLGFRTADDVLRAVGKAQSAVSQETDTSYSISGPGTPQQRDAAVTLAAEIVQGRPVTIQQARELLPEPIRDRAADVLQQAENVADAVAEQIEGAVFDERMMRVLRDAEIRAYYADIIERIQRGEFRRGELTQQARQRVQERLAKALAARQGATVQELKETGFDAVRELQAILPKPKQPKRPKRVGEGSQEDEATLAEEEDIVDVDTVGGDTEGEPPAQAQQDVLPPPPIDPQKWDEYTRKLKDAILAANPDVSEGSPEFLADYRSTMRTVLDEAATELLPSYRREAARVGISKLSDYIKADALDREAQRLADRINSERVRQSKTKLLKQARKFAAAKYLRGRDSATKELIKRKISPEARRWLKLAKDTIKSATATEDLQRLNLFINHPAEALGENETDDDYRAYLEGRYPNLKDQVYKSLPMQELALLLHKSLHDFGNLKERSIGDIEDAIEKLRATTERGKAEIEEAIEARLNRIKPAREAFDKALNVAPGKKAAGIRGSGFGITTMSFLGKMRDVTRYGKQRDIDVARAIAISLNNRIQKAQTQEEAEVRRVTRELHDAVRSIYGRNPVTVIRALIDERNEYKPLSRNRDTALSKANLMQIYASGVQSDYATQAAEYDMRAVARALSRQDMQLIQWFRDYYERARQPISDVSKSVSGIEVISPGANYMPGDIERDLRGLSELHQTSTIVPPALTQRIKHQQSFNETADVFGVFYSRLNEFAHYKAFAELSSDLRGIFGPADFQNRVRDTHGRDYIREFMQHVTTVINGRAESTTVPWATEMINRLRGLAALSALAGNLRVTAGQITSIPAYALELAHRSDGTVTGAIARFFTPDGIEALKTILASEQLKNRFSTGAFEAMTNALANKDSSLFERALQKLMVTVSIGDVIPMLFVGPGIYLPMYRSNIAAGMDEEAAKQDALNSLWAIVEETQQSSSMKNRAAWFRKGPVWGMMAQFSSAASQYLSYETLAYRDVRAKVDGANWRLAENIIINHFILPGLYNIAKQIYSTKILGDEWDDEDVWTLAISMVMGPWSALVIAGGIIESLLRTTFTGKTPWHQKDIPAVSNAVGVAYTIGKIMNRAAHLDVEAVQTEIDRLIRQTFAPYRDIQKRRENL